MSSEQVAAALLSAMLFGCNAPTASLADAACRPEDGGCVPLCPPAPPFGYQVGETAVELGFERCEGGTVTLHDLCEARVGMVVNVYTWCPGCLDNAVLASRLYQEHAGDGLQALIVIGEDAYQEPATPALCREVRDYYQLAGTVVYDAPGVLAAFGETDLVMLTARGSTIYFERRGASEEVITMAVEDGLGDR